MQHEKQRLYRQAKSHTETPLIHFIPLRTPLLLFNPPFFSHCLSFLYPVFCAEKLPDWARSQMPFVEGLFLHTPQNIPATLHPRPLPPIAAFDFLSCRPPRCHCQKRPQARAPPMPAPEPHPDWVLMDADTLGKSFYNTDHLPLSAAVKDLKNRTICEALEKNNVGTLVECLRSTDGLLSNRLRCQIWPVLLDIDGNLGKDGDEYLDKSPSNAPQAALEALGPSDPSAPSSANSAASGSPSLKPPTSVLNADLSLLLDLNCNDLPPHKDEDQVKLDVLRSFTLLSQLEGLHQLYATICTTSEIETLRKSLSQLVIKILRKYPSLNYYQGYHDIASIVLIVCHQNDKQGSSDQTLAFKLLEKLTLFHLRDFMISDINLSVNHLRLIPALLENVDKPLFELIKQTSNSYMAGLFDYSFLQGLSSILTIFAHDISNLHHLLIIWDFTLSYDSVLANVYIYTAFLLFKRDHIFETLNLDNNMDFEAADADLVHTLISPANLFSDISDLDLIRVMNKARDLIEKHPTSTFVNAPATVDIWFKEYNKTSVLENTSNMEMERSLKLTKYRDISSLDKFHHMIQEQDEEIAKQRIYEVTLQQKLLEQQELLATSVNSIDYDEETARFPLLSSSLSSFTSAGSSINTKIAQTSVILKKLFSDGSDDRKKDKAPLVTNFYKVSFTVGFLGFMLHFLVLKNSPSYVRNIIHPLREFRRLVNRDSVELIASFGREVTKLAGDIVNNVYHFLGTSEMVNEGIELGQIGLGNLRNAVYGFLR